MYKRLYKKLSSYSLIIFDMDGTMYLQKSMQIRMGLRLMAHAFFSKGGMREMRTVLDYRKLREGWDSSKQADDNTFFAELSKKYGTDAEEIKSIIQKWMFEIPLDAVRRSGDRELAEVLKRLKSDGKEVCIYSDYPAKDKCAALDLPEDLKIFCCGDEGIRTMKPNPAGLNFIMEQYPDISGDRVIMTGDRKDRDGEAALAAGIDSVILGRFKLIRMITL
ncbi:MAG: HAD hydrolase-like protein [Lachnospiraceae bacterium]|nr:HAD hydrolase-like protein [Lachnospiraceae bacterium]